MQFKRVLIAIDESPLAAHALDAGGAIGRALGADFALVFVVDTRALATPDGGVSADQVRADLERTGREVLAAGAARVGGVPVPWQFISVEHPAEGILRAAGQWGADLIVVGTHGRSGLARVVLGSTAEHVLRHATCAVLVVPPARDVTRTA